MSSTIKLLPCPFCSNAEIAIKNENPKDNSGGYFIECPGCGASTSLRFACGDDPTHLLAEQWNRRTNSHCLHQIQEPAAAEQAAWHAGLDEGRAQAAQAVSVKPQPITLTVNQLRQAIEFGIGGFTPDTKDELETQLSICRGSLKDDEGNVTECMRCWLFEYPEEGAIPLDEQPTERDLASLTTPQAKEDARDPQLLAFAVSEIRRDEFAATQAQADARDASMFEQRMSDLQHGDALDAARYRWLRSRDLETISQGGVFAGMTPENVILNEEDLDQAVDAAIAAAKGK